MNNSFSGLLKYLKADASRYRCSFGKAYFIPGFKYKFWMRLTKYFYGKSKVLHVLAKLKLHSLMYRYGIEIPWITDIGPGFYIGYFGGVVVNGGAKIGMNVNISQGVVVGVHNRGDWKGVPVIEDCVYIGPGAKIFGSVKIGKGAAIGANAVVTKDVPENGVAVGIPARVISFNGSAGYVNLD